MDSDCYRNVSQATRRMQALLKDDVRDVSQMEYIHAKNFLRSLAYEAQPPRKTPFWQPPQRPH